MKNYNRNLFFALILSLGLTFIFGCKKETFDPPTISLSTTQVTASPGDVITVDITKTTDAGFKSLLVTKLWDGVEQGDQEITNESVNAFSYTVLNEDADHVLTFNFKVTDSKNGTAQTELIVTVDLTPMQLLLKYNWRLDAEIRKKTGANDINDKYTDDVYRFNSDGTYDKSIGAKVDDFGDIWFNYCYYDLNDQTLRLLMTRTGAFAEQVTDTLNITVIDDTKIYANVNYYGLNVFDPAYDPVEKYEKRLVAVAKTDSFDPYLPGPDDDDSGPAKMCAEVTLDN